MAKSVHRFSAESPAGPGLTASGTALAESPSSGPRRFSFVYLATLLGSAVGMLLISGLGLAGLGHFDLRPPPQFSNNLCLDEKLDWLRAHPFESPSVLAVGSSVTWRNFDAESVRDVSGGRAAPLNAAFCGLQMNQTAFTAEYFLARSPGVRDVLTIVAPVDLAECSTHDARVFDPKDVDDYIFRHRWRYGFYLKYFDPVTLAKNVWITHVIRNGKLPLDSVVFDRYGGSPLDTTASRPTLVYGALPAVDPVCLSALHELAARLTANRQRLVVVMEPMSPNWIAQYDPEGAGMRRLTDEVRGALVGSSATLWAPGTDLPLRSSAFIDAIHLRLSAARWFSRAIVVATGLGQEPSGDLRATCCSIRPRS